MKQLMISQINKNNFKWKILIPEILLFAMFLTKIHLVFNKNLSISPP